jgi:hypothetical protein
MFEGEQVCLLSAYVPSPHIHHNENLSVLFQKSKSAINLVQTQHLSEQEQPSLVEAQEVIHFN